MIPVSRFRGQCLTSSFRAGPAKMASMSVIPMATQRWRRTWEGTLLFTFCWSLFQSSECVSIVKTTPNNDTEHPMVEISSNACLSFSLTLKKRQNQKHTWSNTHRQPKLFMRIFRLESMGQTSYHTSRNIHSSESCEVVTFTYQFVTVWLVFHSHTSIRFPLSFI